MSDYILNISQPFSIQLKCIEEDAHLPSMRIFYNVNVDIFTCAFTSTGYMWVECSQYDVFLASLEKFPNVEACLNDMEKVFQLTLKTVGSDKLLDFCVCKAGLLGSKASVEYSALLTDDNIATIKNNFRQFDQWW